jgi:hypothetical protein
LFSTKGKKQTLLYITDSNIYRLKKTFTQILAKWELVQPPIQLHQIKLKRTKKEPDQELSNKSRRSVIEAVQTPPLDVYDLVVTQFGGC